MQLEAMIFVQVHGLHLDKDSVFFPNYSIFGFKMMLIVRGSKCFVENVWFGRCCLVRKVADIFDFREVKSCDFQVPCDEPCLLMQVDGDRSFTRDGIFRDEKSGIGDFK